MSAVLNHGSSLAPLVPAQMENSVPGASSLAASGDLDDLFAQLEAEWSGAQPGEQAAADASTVGGDAVMERRFATRRTPQEFGETLRVTVPAALDAQPINLSETGLLMETSNRLRPGSIVEVFLRFNGVRRVLRATIVRSVVHSLSPKPLFRTAFKFEEPTKLPELP